MSTNERDATTGRFLPVDLLDLIADRFGVSDGCWIWTGYKNARGYGRVKHGGRWHAAHRVLYELIEGPIPEGLELDHVRARGCRSTSCVRPSHLEPVTSYENMIRGDGVGALNMRKTHCPSGHEYNKENTHITPTGRRVCRECHRIHQRAYMERKARG